MEINFIGTGSGKASRNRYHSSLMISVANYKLLVDTGDSVARALLNQDISVNSVNGIVISHLHPDHFSGFCSLIVQMQMNDRKDPLNIFVHRSLVSNIKEFLTLSYIFIERIKFPMHFNGFDLEEEIPVSEGLSFISRKNTHLDDYRKFDTSLSFVSGSFLFRSGDKNVYYSGDIGSSADLFLFRDYKTDIFITEAAHVSLESILTVFEQLSPGKIILTHLEEEDLPVIKADLKKRGNKKIVLAKDGLKISV